MNRMVRVGLIQNLEQVRKVGELSLQTSGKSFPGRTSSQSKVGMRLTHLSNSRRPVTRAD